MDSLPLDIKKYFFSYITDPKDVINLMNVDNNSKEIILNNCKYLSSGYRLNLELITKFKNLSRCDSIIKTINLHDIQKIVNCAALKSAKIVSTYEPFIHISDKTLINLVKLQWFYYEHFLTQYREEYQTLMGTHFEFMSDNQQYPIRNIGIDSTQKYNSFYLNTTFHTQEPEDIYASQIISFIDNYIEINAIQTNLTFLDFFTLYTSRTLLNRIIFAHTYLNRDNINYIYELFNPISPNCMKNLQKFKVTINSNIIDQYVPWVKIQFDKFIEGEQEVEEIDDIVYETRLKLDVPLPYDMIEEVIKVFPNLLLISIIAEENVSETIVRLVDKLPKIKLYTTNVDHYKTFLKNYTNVKVVPFYNKHNEMDLKFLNCHP